MNYFPFETYINVNGKRKKIEEKIMLQKNFFERQPCRVRPGPRQLKSLLFEISSAVSFQVGELKLVAKCRQINKLSCGIKIFGNKFGKNTKKVDVNKHMCIPSLAFDCIAKTHFFFFLR